MKPITIDVVETVCSEPYETWGPEKVQQEMSNLLAEQKDMVVFVQAVMNNLDKLSIEMGFWIFFIIYRMFRTAYGKPIKTIPLADIISAHKKTEQMFEELDNDKNTKINEVSDRLYKSQPNVWTYILQSIFQQSEDGNKMPENARGQFFIIFTTIITILDKATEEEIE